MLIQSFWNDDRGAILCAELIIVLTVLVLSTIVGLSTVQTSIINELSDIGMAMDNLNQSYAFTGFSGNVGWKRKSWSAGSSFFDRRSPQISISCNQSIATGAGGVHAGRAATPKFAPAPQPGVPCEVPCEVPSQKPQQRVHPPHGPKGKPGLPAPPRGPAPPRRRRPAED